MFFIHGIYHKKNLTIKKQEINIYVQLENFWHAIPCIIKAYNYSIKGSFTIYLGSISNISFISVAIERKIALI